MSQSAPTDTPAEQVSPKGPRHWGPFTGRQLTTIAVAGLLVVAVPTGAFAAAQLQKVAVTGKNGKTAAVDTHGHLQVGGAVKVSGTANVKGSVTAREAQPSSFVESSTFSLTSGSGCTRVLAPPANSAVVVTHVNWDVFADPSPGSGQTVRLYTDSTCTSSVSDVNPPTVGLYNVDLDPGIGIPANGGLYAQVGGSVDAEAYVYGYKVPSASVPATHVTVHGHSTQH